MSTSRVLGYVRSASSSVQQIENQVNLLMEHGVKAEDIYIDRGSGMMMERPALEVLKRMLQPGDNVVVGSLSQLSRSPVHLRLLLQGWKSRGIGVISIEQRENIPTCGSSVV